MRYFVLKMLFLGVVICLNFISTAQNNFLLKGKIFDSETNSPIPFANIYIVSTSLGVISGEDGCFAFYIPENNRLDTLCISALGYEQFKIVCKDFKNSNDYKLLPKSYPLEEVAVVAISAQDILRKAKKNFKKNYSSKPFILSGDFQEYIREDSNYVRAFEASVNLTENNSFNLNDEIFSIDSVSLSANKIMEDNLKLLFKDQILSNYFDFGVFLNYFSIDNDAKYSVESIIQNGNDKTFIVKCVGEVYESIYHINSSDYAITYYYSTQTEPAINSSETKDVWRDYLEDSQKLTFRKYGLFYYPTYFYNYLTLRQHKGKDNSIPLYTYTSITQMLVTNIETDVNAVKNKRLRKKYDDVYFSKAPVRNIWKNYNSLPNSEVRDNALRQLGIN